MKQSYKQEYILKYKFIYTVLILLVYVLGKGLPLYMVDYSAYRHVMMDAEGLLVQTISGDIQQCSIFALGISPFMISSICVQIYSAFMSQEKKSKLSQVKMNKISLFIMLFVAIIQAIVRVGELAYKVSGEMLLVARVVSAIELVAGAVIIKWLCTRNKKYGIGGQSALIFVNVLDGIFVTITNNKIAELLIPLVISIIVIFVMIYMENAELRIPVQRISIHNIYADKNYLAIKLNPIGVMPAMFSMAFFMLPQLFIQALAWMMPNNQNVLFWQENLTLNKPVGVVVYIFILYILTIGFSRVFINPKEITEQFLKSGDSLVDIHAGRDTRKYLSRSINFLSIVSATVMSICLGLPLVLQLTGVINGTFATLPSSVMIMTGIWCNLHREVLSIKDLEAYKPFI